MRRQVTADLCTFYRPETLDHIEQILEHEQNPEIQAVAIRALGKFQDKRVAEADYEVPQVRAHFATC